MLCHGLAGLVVDLERAEDALFVVQMEISGGLGVDASELGEHRLAALLVPAGFQLRAVSAVLVTAGEAVTGEQGIEVKPRAADDDGLLPA